jgi:diguanylate cyclase (GGDEF)-like protein
MIFAAARTLPRRTALGSERQSHYQSEQRVAFGVGIVLVALTVCHIAGLTTGDTLYVTVIFGGALAGTIGASRCQATPRWPAWALVLSGLFWLVAGALAFGAGGDLSDTRSLLPDLFSIPGYLLFAGGIWGILHARRRRSDDSSMALDVAILTLGATLVVYQVIIVPTLAIPDAWVPAQTVVAFYPAVSIVILGLAAQLAFNGGHRTPTFWFMLFGSLCLVVGDFVWALAEIGQFDATGRLVEVPYMLVPTSFGVAMLHPAMQRITATAPTTSDVSVARRFTIASSVVAPAVMFIWLLSSSLLVSTLLLLMFVASATRVAIAIKTQQTSKNKLVYAATHDGLTDLPTRGLLETEIDRRLARPTAMPLSLLFVDLDRFKTINDTWGHLLGDQILILVADRLANATRPTDIVGRISSDEFIVLLPNTTPTEAAQTADRIRAQIAVPFDVEANRIFVTASIGVSTATSTEDKPTPTATSMMREADTAMYDAKEHGRDRTVVFAEAMHQRAARRAEIETMLQSSKDSPDLSVVYQPIVDSVTEQVVGFEALLRWSKNGQSISPAEIIPVAEETGHIVPIGEYVLGEACRQAAYWRANIPGGENLTVSVNLSPRQIVDDGIVAAVRKALRDNDLAPEALWLEITEGVMTADTAVVFAALSGIRALGVRLAIDDFGTGYSSIQYLRRLPVQRLKIDKAFVHRMLDDPRDQQVVSAVILMAQAFELDVVAEGVETAEQAAALKELGCQKLQGFRFSPGVPPGDVQAIVQKFWSKPARPHHHRTHARRIAQ